MSDQEQRTEELDDGVEKLDRIEEPDVEARALDETDRKDAGETEEPDVQAHRLEPLEGRDESLD